MQRKLIQLSPSTAVVSMPSSWVKANRLKKGQQVSVDVQDNRVVVAAESNKAENEVKLDISKLEGKLVWIAIDAAYIAGHDSIIISTKDAAQAALMGKVVRYFPGMMIFDERKNMVHFKSIAGQDREDVGKILSRIFNLDISMAEDAAGMIKSRDYSSLAGMKKRDYAINSYISYCNRQINKFGFSPFSKTGVMHTYLKLLEMLADAMSALFVEIGENKAGIGTEPVNMLAELLKHLQAMHASFSNEKLILSEEKRQAALKKAKSMPSVVRHPYSRVMELFFDLEELELQMNG
ncbi:MAG TPA: hypothetical protein HA362_02330 [Nanoarchaeota archaeon]|nr:hypothetical protein [Nanoarchaeota archaeon]